MCSDFGSNAESSNHNKYNLRDRNPKRRSKRDNTHTCLPHDTFCVNHASSQHESDGKADSKALNWLVKYGIRVAAVIRSRTSPGKFADPLVLVPLCVHLHFWSDLGVDKE